MSHEGYHSIERPSPSVDQGVQYYLARLEGQVARIELLTNGYYWHEHEAFITAIADAKGFLKNLRLALDPHRLDVI